MPYPSKKPVPPAPPQPIRLTRQELAEALTKAGYPISKATLATKASRGGGPVFQRFGNRVLYDLDKALAWARTQLVDVPSKPRER